MNIVQKQEIENILNAYLPEISIATKTHLRDVFMQAFCNNTTSSGAVITPTISFKSYQEESVTDITVKEKVQEAYPYVSPELASALRQLYPVLTLAAEAGEVMGKFQKIIRDKGFIFDSADIESLKKELGDVLWSLAVVSADLGLTLEEVAIANIMKLRNRKLKATIEGSGDDR